MNELENSVANKSPHLVKEWHPNRNGSLTPYNTTYKNGKKVWWICEKGHEWKTAVHHRSNGNKCPYCSGRKVCLENCLAATHPELVKEWHPTKNKKLTAFQCTYGSRIKVWWICAKNHEYEACIYNRHNKKGCPYCSKNKCCASNCFGALFPHLIQEYSNKNILSIFNISPKSNKLYWWICKKGHEWKDTASHRSEGRCCPYCSNHRVTLENCLAIVAPTLAQEWHSSKNADLTPYDITSNSSKKVWWTCSKKHEWMSTVAHRNGDGTGCPYCNYFGSESKGEKRINQYLNELNIDFIRQARFDSCRNIATLPFDFQVSHNNNIFLIEYQGQQHYKAYSFNKKKDKYESFEKLKSRDKIKLEWTIQNNIPLLIIPYWDYDNIETIITDFMNQLESKQKNEQLN